MDSRRELEIGLSTVYVGSTHLKTRLTTLLVGVCYREQGQRDSGWLVLVLCIHGLSVNRGYGKAYLEPSGAHKPC